MSYERSDLVLWKKPLKTSTFFIKEVYCSILDAKESISRWAFSPNQRNNSLSFIRVEVHRFLYILFFLSVALLLSFLVFNDDPESKKIRDVISWYSYWVFLGILSSVGLGTGLHTFLLYLGPFIAKVTLAAQECGSVHFPKPPYPDQVVCPDLESMVDRVGVSDIMGKIRWESLMWGFGTALGELPPYFMAKAARLSGIEAEEEQLEEFNQLQKHKKQTHPSKPSLLEKGKLWMQDLVQKVGFWGILACASIPNPLFDLAGITCGHFLVPFGTFFWATVIGKAIIKVHLQMTFVIIAFNEDLLDKVVRIIRALPKIGPILSDSFVEMMNHQKHSLHNKADDASEGGLLAFILEKIVLVMVVYFIISIINSMAQSHHKRISKPSEETKKKKK